MTHKPQRSDDPMLDMHGRQITGSGCGVDGCGVPARAHVQLYTTGTGWHMWQQPTPALIAWRLRKLRLAADRKRVEDGQAALVRAEQQELARWLHDDGPVPR